MITTENELVYGKIIDEIVFDDESKESSMTAYRNKTVINRIRTIEQPIPINNRQELMDVIFDQLATLIEGHSVKFEVFADKYSHEPTRIVVTSKQILD